MNIKLIKYDSACRAIAAAKRVDELGISEPTFRRHFAHLIEKTSPGRVTVRLGDVLD